MKFIIATNNKKKLVEMERILKPLGIEAVSAKDAGVVLDEVDETGTTFGENAFLKANAAYIKTGMPAVADDSGICVDALGGRPGIFSARYSPEDCVTDEDRTAAFRTRNAALITPALSAAFFPTAAKLRSKKPAREKSATSSSATAASATTRFSTSETRPSPR